MLSSRAIGAGSVLGCFFGMQFNVYAHSVSDDIDEGRRAMFQVQGGSDSGEIAYRVSWTAFETS